MPCLESARSRFVLTMLAVAMLLSSCGGNDGDPSPAISSLVPTDVTAGGAAFTLTVNGSGFVSTSAVNWNNTALTTTYVSPSQLKAAVPASDISSTGSASVAVSNESPGGGVSSASIVDINGTNPVPAISSLAPTDVTAADAGFTLTVNGSAFVFASTVDWNNAALTTTYVSPSQLTAVVPASDISSAGSATITVSNPAPGGGASSASVFDINSANPAPGISSLAPTGVTAGGGTFTLTVNGSGFVFTSAVNWNGTALSTTFVSQSQLTAAVPASDISSTGSASITVSNPAPGGGASSASVFDINSANPAPGISSLAPTGVTAGGGTFTLTVNGSGFVSTSAVNWNGTALSTTFVSQSQLTAAVPASDISSTGSASITVSNPAPGGGASSASVFDINSANPAPGVSSLAPTGVTAGGGAFTLTVNGSGFVSTSAVNWNGTALSTTFVSQSQLKAAVPASDISSIGSASITVSNPAPGGGASSASVFDINSANPAPGISSLAPSINPVGSGAFTLTVNGNGFVSTSAVNWNGAVLPTTYVSASQLSASVPGSDIASAGNASITVSNPTPGGGTSSAASFTISNVVAGSAPTQVQILLQGQDAQGEDQNDTLPPENANHITIGWLSVPGASSYNIYRSVSKGGYGSTPYASVAASSAASAYSSYVSNSGSYPYVTTVNSAWQDTAAMNAVGYPKGSGPVYFGNAVGYTYKVSAVVGGVEGPPSTDSILVLFANGTRVMGQDIFNGSITWNTTGPGTPSPLGFNNASLWNVSPALILINPYVGVGGYEYNLTVAGFNYMVVNMYTASSGGPFTFRLGPELSGDQALLSGAGYFTPEPTLTAGTWQTIKIPLSQYLIDQLGGTNALQSSYYKTTIVCDQNSASPEIYLEWYFSVN